MSGTKELYLKARPVIDRVLELTRAKQTDFVEEACGADAELAVLVRSLLRQRDNLIPADEDFSFFKILNVSIGEDSLPAEFGSYQVLGRLGTGGMSIVCLAEQSNPRRLVAIKVLRRAVPQNLLQREAETLALLRHPGIAQIFEAGIAATPEGDRPFFVMEFVSSTGDTKKTSETTAQTLLEYIALRPKCSLRDRLELVARVCDAVDYAHKRGVIHRDLKPANILVDHLGHPKVIDFGIAMLADSKGADSGGSSLPNVVAGTLPYMSPEQHKGDLSRIDLRSDVYALGVVCYQLLASSLPYDQLAGVEEKNVEIIQLTEPVPLSSRSKWFPRDIDCIVSKAMMKDPNLRYQSTNELACDIRRFIAKKPVAARRNTLLYRFECLLRRRPVISGTATLALLLIAMAVFQAYRENAGAKDALALLVTGIINADSITLDGSVPTLAHMLDSIAKDVDERTSLHRDSAASIHLILGSLYFRAGPRGGDSTLKAGHHYLRAFEILESNYGASDRRTLSVENNLAMALSKAGKPAEAAHILEDLIPRREAIGDWHGALISRGNYAAALLRMDRHEEATSQFEVVFEEFVKEGDKRSALVARAWQARVLMDAGSLAEAELLQRDALQRSISEGPGLADLSLAIMDGLTHCMIYQKKWNKALVDLQEMREYARRFAAAEQRVHQIILSKLLQVQRELNDRNGAEATTKDLETWEAQYGSRS